MNTRIRTTRTNVTFRRGVTTVLWAILSGVLLAAALLVLVWVIEPEPIERRERHRDVDVTELVTPGALSQEELEKAEPTMENSAIMLEQGAWVQVADDEGGLAQQYSADRIDPLPNGLLEMQRPRARIYLGGGRVLVLRGEHGLLDAPQQAIESGTLDGDVVIRLFSPRNGVDIDLLNDDPEVIVRTEQASFDSNLGEIRCDGAIRVDSREASFAGEGLTVLLGSSGRTIKRLRIDRATEPVRIFRRQSLQSSADADAGTTTRNESPNDVSDADDPDHLFYRLELQDNVRITRYVDETSDVADALVRGQTLVTVFSLDGDGFSKASPPTKTVQHPAVSHPISRVDLLGASILGNTRDQPSEIEQQLIEIEFDGSLLMTIAEPEEQPGSVDDLTVRIDRGAGRRVEIVDAATKAVATCSSLTYDSEIDRIELVGDETDQLLVDSPDFQMRGRSFWLLREQGIGGLDGAGSMAFNGAGESSTPVKLSWVDGVNLEFEPESETLRRAVFDTGVRVESLDFTMQSERLDVRLGGGEDGSAPRLERILASGDDALPVKARRTNEPGLLIARELDLILRQDASGDPHPEHLVASGGIQASDPQQTIWADDLDVRFDRSDTSELVVGRLEASGTVELMLASGARAWGERLIGNGVRRTVELSSIDGEVVLMRGNVLADSLQVIRFDDQTKSAESDGPGRFRFYEGPLMIAGQGRMASPTLQDLQDVTPSLEATWGGSMRFKDDENDGASALELEGDVIVRNRPDVYEENDLDAGFLRLDFSRRASNPVVDSEGLPLNANAREAFSNSRDLVALLAREGARMESRAWRDETHVGDPDLFRIEGGDIRYDATTGEAVVKGPGSLLMNRVPDSTSAETSDETRSPALSFGSDGTTRFSWTQGMAMKKTVADRYVVSMSGDVEVLHAGLENDDTLTLSSARVSALIDRPLENATDSNMTSDGGLDLGGQAQILRLTSSGQVYARTTDHDVQCERFEYDVANGIAELQAQDGRMVTVVSRGSPTPIRATSMRWDMRSGRIQISGARGGMGR